jgi:cysteine protease ATG4
MCVQPKPPKALYTFATPLRTAYHRPTSSNYLVGSQAKNLFYLDPHHTRPTIPLRPLTQTADPEHGITSKTCIVHPPPGHHRSPASIACSGTGSSTFSYPTVSPLPFSKQLLTSDSFSRGAHVRWNSAGANGGVLELLAAASNVGLDATQMHDVTPYNTMELRTFHCERMRKMPLSGPGSIRICSSGFRARLGRTGSIFIAD